MSVEAHPFAPSARWAGLPLSGVVRVAGADRAAMAVSLDSAAVGAPAVIGCDVDPTHTAPHIVDDVVDQLSAAARDLFPAWLPGGEVASSTTDFERRTVRLLARSLASVSAHYGPFLEALAEDALSGLATSSRFPPAIRLVGLARVLSAAYRCESVVVMLEGRRVSNAVDGIGAAAAWLADHGGIGVWLVGAELAGVDRFPATAPHLPDFVDRLAPTPAVAPHRPDYPAVAGLPHPRSTAEQRLEERLATCAWARGRVWNQVHQSNSLTPPIRVDLLFPDARCAVEIDGPDHRGVLKYADDRRRDNTLTLDGYAVLRFTNDDVHDDVARVLATIERLLIDRTPTKGDTP
jgi:very-short-patch-repair endonuclease